MSADTSELLGLPTVARLVTIVRVAVVASVAVLLLYGSPPVRSHPALAWTITAIAVVYAMAVVRWVGWELRGTRQAALISLTDATLATLLVAATGASRSPMVAIMFLVVVGTSIHLDIRPALVLTTVVAGAMFAVAMFVEPAQPLRQRLEFSMWWSLYLLFAGILAAGLAVLAVRQWEAVLAARAEALAERNTAEQERDLRERLLASHQAQQDGLRIILHEFRTPVESLRALARSLVRGGADTDAETQRTTATLVESHAEHLTEMLDGLADVARTEGSPLGAARRRSVDLESFLVAAADAAGLRPPRLHLTVHPEGATLVLDVARLRRVVTNLADNAIRHADSGPVDIGAHVDGQTLSITVADRGPGLAPEQLQQVTQKYVSFGDSRGTVGLGLWIVEQLVRALGGELYFHSRQGGGLRVDLTIPV